MLKLERAEMERKRFRFSVLSDMVVYFFEKYKPMIRDCILNIISLIVYCQLF